MDSGLKEIYLRTKDLALEGKNEEVVPLLRSVVKHIPNFGEAWYNLGLALCKLDRDEESIEVLNKAIELRPYDWNAWSVKARCYGNMGWFDEAVGCLKEALRLDPENKQTQWKLSYYLLMQGKFKEAAPYEEWWRTCGARARIRTWYGHRPPGESIFVYPDGGIGDSINYFRYCLLLGKHFGVKHTYVGCYNELYSMFARQIPREYLVNFGPVAARNNGAECILNWDVDVPPTESRTYQSDLFPIFNFQHFPESVPYLTPDPAKVEEWAKFFTGNRLKVGLIWQGHKGGNNDDRRSIPLSYFKPFNDLDIDLYLMQAKYGLEQVAEAGVKFRSNLGFMFDVNSMEDMAGAVAHMDLVVSVCTGGAHLVAAMGKPVYLLLSNLACWRWMRDREDTPFYPSMTLFRQGYDKDWHKVIHSVRECIFFKAKHKELTS